MNRLEASHISVILKHRPVLKDVSCRVGQGELLGVLGPNGAGKTTLLKVLAGLLDPGSGSVVLNGRPIADWPLVERARQIGYLAQQAACHWPLAVEQVVALGRMPHRTPWQPLSAADLDRVEASMDYTGIRHLAGRPLDELSGGERSRVMLARAIAAEPRILLADEPVAGLDPAQQINVMSLLKGLGSQGVSTVVVLHDLTLAARYCDRLLLVNAGKLKAEGPPDQVLTPENLADCYGIRVYAGRIGEGVFVVPTERIQEQGGH